MIKELQFFFYVVCWAKHKMKNSKTEPRKSREPGKGMKFQTYENSIVYKIMKIEYLKYNTLRRHKSKKKGT